MRLIVVRHAIAMDREEFAATKQDDDLRPLTPDGRRKMRLGAKGLRALAPHPTVLATSPLTRAVETAQILAAAFDMTITETVESLRPDSPYSAIEQWLRKRNGAETVAIVGHEPHLSGLIAWFVTSGTTARFDLKKGGAALLAFDGRPRRGLATLEWLVTPWQLRRLG
jgi:phosphohistidine phosphatase